jgi:N-methylhydantoinase B
MSLLNEEAVAESWRRNLSWDGVVRGYVPRSAEVDDIPLAPGTSPALDNTVDPVTYEVIRYGLMNLNFEHSSLLSQLCVSPVTMLVKDFQTAILKDDGDLVFLGPAAVYFANASSLCIKWILERRLVNPGIGQDDMFLCNDPYVGAPHQPDTNLVAPVFIDGELFCWVANIMHHADVGGEKPGSLCVDATDVWGDPPCFPPIRVVEGGKLRRDIVEVFLRQSRLPHTVSMDLRAAIAGNESAKRKILALAERYGKKIVAAVMQRTMDAGERLFIERLEHIPDGKWSHRLYAEAAVGDYEQSYCYQYNIEKLGSVLYVDNAGTDVQAGSINATFAAFSGAFLGALAAQMTPDLAGAYGGVYRRVVFRPVPGTLSCADYPAAVSPAGVYTNPRLLSCAASVVGKMLLSGDDHARRMMFGPSLSTNNAVVFSGRNRAGTYYVMPNTDQLMGATGAMLNRDGVDSGGHYWIPEGLAFDIEEVERDYPVLYLYRKLLGIGLDGAGRYRGGLGFAEASAPWGVSTLTMDLYTDEAFAKVSGQCGGYPGSRGWFRLMRGTNLRSRLRGGRMPTSIDELSAHELADLRSGSALAVGPDDVWEYSSPSAAGLGDPLERELASVARDVTNGLLTIDTADRVYGAVFGETRSEVDIHASAALRRRRMAERVGDGHVPRARPTPGSGNETRSLLDALGVRTGPGGTGSFICMRCGWVVGGLAENYKAFCLLDEIPLASLGPEFASPTALAARAMVFRRFACPNCGVLFETEIARLGDGFLADVALRAETR